MQHVDLDGMYRQLSDALGRFDHHLLALTRQGIDQMHTDPKIALAQPPDTVLEFRIGMRAVHRLGRLIMHALQAQFDPDLPLIAQ